MENIFHDFLKYSICGWGNALKTENTASYLFA